MRPRIAWLLLPLMTACAYGPRGNTPQAICQRDALNDPTVKQITIEQMNSGAMSARAKFTYTQALHAAYNNCLRRRGIVARGGVEPVQPSY